MKEYVIVQKWHILVQVVCCYYCTGSYSPLAGFGLLIVEVSRSHTRTHGFGPRVFLNTVRNVVLSLYWG